MKASVALLVSGLAAQQVAATWSYGANPFNSPNYSNNECNDKQKEGFDWSGLQDGDSNFEYGDFDFKKGWTCSNSFGKRDLLTKRTFSSKCIKNKVRRDAPASFGCGEQKKDGFSVTNFDVSVEFDCDVELHYKMPDESVCKQTASCKREGTTIHNTQCGGARSVDVYLGNHQEADREDCEIGLHHIGFDCNPGESYTPPSPPEYTPVSSVIVSSSAPVETPATSAVLSTQQPYTNSSAPVNTPAPSCDGSDCGNSAPVETPINTPVPTCDGEDCGNSAPVETPSNTPAPSCDGYGCGDAPSDSSVPAGETPVPSTPAGETPVNTPYPTCNGDDCNGETPAESSSVPAIETSASPDEPASSSAPAESTPTSPPAGAGPPECLPKCMNTWLQINSECKDNTDANCYCKNNKFTKSVVDCVAAWAKDDSETQQALQYFIGICAEHVPENPGIVTDCPTNVPLNPTPTPTPAPSVPATTELPEVPATTPAPECPGCDVPETPASSGVPEVPEVPASSGVPEVPEVPASSGVPEVPEVPASSGVPDVPASSGAPEYPVSSAVPECPGCDVPETPASSGVPEVPEVPASSGVPEVPVGTTAAPEAPGYTPVPECPGGADCPAPEVPEGTTPAPEAPGYTPVPECPGGADCPAPEVPEATTPAPEAPGYTPVPECPGGADCPAPEVPEGTTAAPESPAPTGPAPGSPSDIPYTTITYGTTSVTVPQVHFTTPSPDAPGANPEEPVGLVPGTEPPSTPAQTTPVAPYPAQSTLGTVTAPTGTGYIPTSAPEFTGAASAFNVEVKHAVFGAALAFFAL